MGLFEKVFGTHSEKELKKIKPLIDKIEALDSDMQALSDEELKAKTQEFKDRLAKGETLDDLLVEAFAVVREAAYRVLGMKHYRVQLIGGVILHQGRIAEMRTGEGKTLVSTLPAYLNALEGKGVHVVTVNDYLAKRDAEWMGKVHEFLGLTVGIILNSSTPEERRAAYNCDITYVTNNELGFDYLRDNMVIYKEKLVLRGLHYCVIDEVDSVLIDEARTPLIISGQSGKSTELYRMCDYLARRMKRGEGDGEISKMDMLMNNVAEEDGDFLVNEKDKYVMLTANGVKEVEQFFHIDNLSDPDNMEIQHNIILALRAHNLMFRDRDYVVKDDEVLIVDEFTGRIMPGDRGESKFYLSLEDDLMRLFGSERVMGLYDALKIPEGEEIQHRTISNFVEKAQMKIESNNFAIRKSLLEYDQVNNEQREIIYKERRRVLDGEDMHEVILKMIKDDVNSCVDQVCSRESHPENWDITELDDMLRNIIPYPEHIQLKDNEKDGDIAALKERLTDEALDLYKKKEEEIGDEQQMREIERIMLLKVIDRKWTDHIDDMDRLKQGIGLQSLGQRDPVVEYKFAGYDMFNAMTASIQEDTVKLIMRVKVEQKVEREEVNKVTGTNKDDTVTKGPVKKAKKIGRNDPCPCGSGKKYKNCCGRDQ